MSINSIPSSPVSVCRGFIIPRSSALTQSIPPRRSYGKLANASAGSCKDANALFAGSWIPSSFSGTVIACCSNCLLSRQGFPFMPLLPPTTYCADLDCDFGPSLLQDITNITIEKIQKLKTKRFFPDINAHSPSAHKTKFSSYIFPFLCPLSLVSNIPPHFLPVSARSRYRPLYGPLTKLNVHPYFSHSHSHLFLSITLCYPGDFD